MKKAQYRDDSGKWKAIASFSPTADPIKVAYDHCKQFGLSTRVVEMIEGPEAKEEVVREFRCQRRPNSR